MVIEKTAMKDVILEMTSKKLGVTTVRDERGRLKGIITDGDLRRVLQRHDNPLLLKASEVMTPGAKTISSDALAVKAVQVMETHSITSLVVVNDSRRIEGIIHLHDLLKMGVV